METLALLQARAEVLRSLREFFALEGVLEVETPLLASSTTTEPYLNHLSLSVADKKHFLLSSPEFSMKRLLIRGSGSIFQICKAFRAEEEGRNHRCEFTMLEWYMLDWNLEQLMEQVARLIKQQTNFSTVIKKSYGECFEEYFSCDPHYINASSLRNIVAKHIEVESLSSFSKDECLHLLFAEKIEKSFDKNSITFVYDFPASQAALAELGENSAGDIVAKRFEVYAGGLELANAYKEEASPTNLRKRFHADNEIRESLGKELIPLDEKFLLAMEQGLPKCSGIALGLDRLLMLKLGKANIKDVLSF